MGEQNFKSIKLGIANHSPLDFDSYIDKSLIRTVDPDNQHADVLYTRKLVKSLIPIQIVFNDYDFLESWGLLVGDTKNGEATELSNKLTDKLIRGKV